MAYFSRYLKGYRHWTTSSPWATNLVFVAVCQGTGWADMDPIVAMRCSTTTVLQMGLEMLWPMHIGWVGRVGTWRSTVYHTAVVQVKEEEEYYCIVVKVKLLCTYDTSEALISHPHWPPACTLIQYYNTSVRTLFLNRFIVSYVQYTFPYIQLRSG